MGNYKSLIKEIKDLSSLRDSLCSRIVKTKLWILLSVIYRLYPSRVRMPASWFVNVDKLNGTNGRAWKKKNKFRGLTLPSFSKLPVEPQGSRSRGTGKTEDVHVWEQNTEPRNSQPWSTHEKHQCNLNWGAILQDTSSQSCQGPQTKGGRRDCPARRSLKRQKKTKCNVGS